MSAGVAPGPSFGSGGRFAHPIGSGRAFGPSRSFRDGFRGDGFHGRFHDRDDFFFRGGFGVGFVPWWGAGFGLGFGWDYPWGWGPGFYGSFGWWDPWWHGYNPGYWGYPGYGYDGYYGGGYYGGGGGYSSPRTHEDMGALDLDISPSDTEVYLNGEYVGRVRDFGGWGRGYLWLQKGTYDVVFYHQGYKTLARQVTVPGPGHQVG